VEVIEMTRLVNLTPHEVRIITPEGEIVLPPTGVVARVKEIVRDVGSIEFNGVRIPIRVKVLSEEVENLPPPEEGTIYITSYLAAEAAWRKGRTDVMSVGDPIRNEKGEIKGVSSLYTNPYLP
jgi:hypothetical protein